jgi:hypothetical protein
VAETILKESKMKHKEKLAKLLEGQLAWQGSRIDFVACFLLSLIRQKSVNWVNISLAFASEAQAESNYRRIQRFFQTFSFEQSDISESNIKLSLNVWVADLNFGVENNLYVRSGRPSARRR